MSFCIDFCTGIVMCDGCMKPIKPHVDFLLKKTEESTSLINKECYQSSKKFLSNLTINRYNYETGRVSPYEPPSDCDCDCECL